MSEPVTPQASGPIFRLQKMYVKDLSFENPSAPEIYVQNPEPKVDFRLTLGHRKIEADNWEVTLKVTCTVTSKEKTVFICEIEHAGLFHIRGIPEEHLERVLSVECPTLLFPFTRQIICQATVDGGFVPLLMEPINFHAMYESTLQARQQTEKH